MLPAAARADLEMQLDRLETRVRQIRKKADTRQDCRDLLNELAAAEAAFSKISQAVRSLHMEHCVPDGDAEALDELVTIFDRYAS